MYVSVFPSLFPYITGKLSLISTEFDTVMTGVLTMFAYECILLMFSLRNEHVFAYSSIDKQLLYKAEISATDLKVFDMLCLL